MEMDGELQEIVRVFEAVLSQIKWRLKPSSKYRLQTDILALCSRMRPCIMVDYGGKMPELGDHLCAFLRHCRKESPKKFELLRVMVIEDMIYLIEVRALADFVKSSSCMEIEMRFVDLVNDPPTMATKENESSSVMQLLSAQKLFSSVFHANGVIIDCLQRFEGSSNSKSPNSESLEIVDLSCCLQESEVTIPTLNGWLLGYPVVYLFGRDHIEKAIYNLSTKSLHVYQIFVDRVEASSKGYRKEELLSFTVPYELSLEGRNEAWAKSYLSYICEKREKCNNIWGSLHMEVSVCNPQAIAL